MTVDTAVDDGWRGVAKDDDEVDVLPAGAGLRMQTRARRLLGDLVHEAWRASLAR